MEFDSFIEETPLPEFLDSDAVHKFQLSFFVPENMSYLEVAEATKEFVASLSI